ncbi:MAG: thioredoxin family protein [Chitinophagaceae bacterium]|nr:thioredoxin family protein [Chitinophagaceae bacterium]
MKAVFIFIMSVALLGTSFTEPPIEDSTTGIKFQNISLQKALLEAKQQHKMVFLNAYAVWCIPCKQLKATTFQASPVANLVNQKCISLDVDVEKGEGITIAKKYKITAHPLVLIINPDGKVVKRVLGYMDANDFLKEVKPVLN